MDEMVIRKKICEEAIRKNKNPDRNISKEASGLVEERRVFCKYLLID
jgi:hypothetical protein